MSTNLSLLYDVHTSDLNKMKLDLELTTPEIKELQKLMAMSILPLMPIVLIQAYPSYVFEIDHTRYAVDKEIAECIQVRIVG